MKTTLHNPKRPTAGFTLLEVILAITVTAIVSAALFTSLSGSFKTRRQAEDHLSGRATARSVMEILRADMVCVPPAGGRIGGIFIGADVSGMNSYDADTLTYVTANPNLKSEQDLADLRGIDLQLLESSDDPDHYVLVRQVTGNLMAVTAPEPTVQVLARRVVSMNIRYYDGGEWIDVWDSTELDNATPLAIEVSLIIAPKLTNEPEDEDDLEETYITITQVIRLPTAVLAGGEGEGGVNLGF